MTLSFNEYKTKYINEAGVKLIARVHSAPAVKAPAPDYTDHAYLAHKRTVNWGKPIGIMKMSRKNILGKYVEKAWELEEWTITLSQADLEEVYKVSTNVLKDQDINAVISENYLVEEICEWAFLQHQQPNPVETLSQYLLHSFAKAIKTQKIYIPILYLESNKDFFIGNIYFGYLSDDHIKTLSLKLDEADREGYIKQFEPLKGQLLASCPIEAEKEKAIEIASRQILLSVDILRILSKTIEYPSLPIYFDVDFRNTHQEEHRVVIQNISETHLFSMIRSAKHEAWVINQAEWERISQLGLPLFNHFLLRTREKQNELESLIFNSIKNFSKAIATHNLHDRTVQIFSVLESLLLKDESVPIIESICKYLPKLVTPVVSLRKEIISLIKKMYQVRSASIHHGQQKEIEQIDLTRLQHLTLALLRCLISVSSTKPTKREVLQEIDDRIMSV